MPPLQDPYAAPRDPLTKLRASDPALIGLAHGSRHPEGSHGIERLMAAVAEQAKITTVPAYLDLAQPDLGDAVRRLVQFGHTAAVVVPLLFTEAYHATIDVPQTVREVTASGDFQLIVAEILGTGDDVAHLVRESMVAAGIADHSSVLLFAVGSSNQAANDAVVDLARRLADGRQGPVRACFGTCRPGVTDVLDGMAEPVAAVPLFLAEGLLLAPLRKLAAERGWQMAEPLGERAADLVRKRYDASIF
ncbi:MAG TPA: sirohydrochlorin chelatase [Propionibacteriaceae bacterium]|nr:sirohydrochlorin chelatase [Propionibacteriaceae bacterium]